MPQPSESGCRKSRGEIESLVVHQTWGRWIISPPTYIHIDVEQLLFTQVHHKVSKNGFKVGEALLHCLKRGRAWICFDFQLYFPPNLTDISCQSSSSIASKEGELGFVSIVNYCISHQISLRLAARALPQLPQKWISELGFVLIVNYCISHKILLTFAVASSLCGVEQQCRGIAVYSATALRGSQQLSH